MRAKSKNWSRCANVGYRGKMPLKELIMIYHILDSTLQSPSRSLINAESLQNASSVYYRRMGFSRHHRETCATDFHSSSGDGNISRLCIEETKFVAAR